MKLVSQTKMEIETNAKELNKSNIGSYLVLIGFVIMIITSLLITVEIAKARKFCKINEGEYSIQFLPLPPKHLCNGKTLAMYDGNVFDFEREEVNFSFKNG